MVFTFVLLVELELSEVVCLTFSLGLEALADLFRVCGCPSFVNVV
jgi:hypothetical protein